MSIHNSRWRTAAIQAVASIIFAIIFGLVFIRVSDYLLEQVNSSADLAGILLLLTAGVGFIIPLYYLYSRNTPSRTVRDGLFGIAVIWAVFYVVTGLFDGEPESSLELATEVGAVVMVPAIVFDITSQWDGIG